MLKDIDFPKSREYRTGTQNQPIQFFHSAFSESKTADILLGYFSFSALRVLAFGFAKFIANGGRLRIIANDVLSSKDKEAILSAPEYASDIIDLSDFESLKTRLDSYGLHFFECMSYLFAHDRIELVITRPKSQRGISHYKSGLFADEDSEVGFKGSCNFTASGMIENSEELSAYLSWDDTHSTNRIESQKEYFELIYSKGAHFLEYIPVDQVKDRIISEFGDKTLEELEEEALKLFKEAKNTESYDSSEPYRALEEVTKGNEPRFPFPSGPRDYQIEAYEAWIKNGKSGVFAMATGTGKTITSLNCLLNEYQTEGKYRAIILVPSIALLNQWEKEVQSFQFDSVLKVGGGNNWESALATYVSNSSWGFENNLILISTYGSFVTDRFQKYFKKIQTKFLLVADEAHNMGANNVRKLLPEVNVERRIGLSATPKRIYDEEGTEALDQFFNDKPPYIYQFGMEKALQEGFLTEYVYFPILVELEPEELDEYMEISKKLLRFFDSATGTFKKDPMVEILLLKRKNIIHKAARKILAFKTIVQDLKKKDKLKYVFTYVPEGYVENAEGDREKMLDQFLRAGAEVEPSLKMNSYTTSDSDLKVLLRGFSEGKIDLLFAMKMLDEGVDVPRAEVGIFCSSTGNPRQFIQRRGRLLRKHKEKAFATIYDMVVTPRLSRERNNLFNMERSLVKKELQRVGYFASLSMNYYDSKAELENICKKYELNLDQIIEEL